jgi:hypothetical protein
VCAYNWVRLQLHGLQLQLGCSQDATQSTILTKMYYSDCKAIKKLAPVIEIFLLSHFSPLSQPKCIQLSLLRYSCREYTCVLFVRCLLHVHDPHSQLAWSLFLLTYTVLEDFLDFRVIFGFRGETFDSKEQVVPVKAAST